MLLDVLQFLAVATASWFAGAALYINVAEHPSRLALESRSAVLQWAVSYAKAAWMQASLAVVSFLAGVAVWWLGGEPGWLGAAIAIGLAVPYTLIAIMPTNRRLLVADGSLGADESRDLLKTWGKQHAVRTLLGLAASVAYIWLSLAR